MPVVLRLSAGLIAAFGIACVYLAWPAETLIRSEPNWDLECRRFYDSLPLGFPQCERVLNVAGLILPGAIAALTLFLSLVLIGIASIARARRA